MISTYFIPLAALLRSEVRLRSVTCLLSSTPLTRSVYPLYLEMDNQIHMSTNPWPGGHSHYHQHKHHQHHIIRSMLLEWSQLPVKQPLVFHDCATHTSALPWHSGTLMIMMMMMIMIIWWWWWWSYDDGGDDDYDNDDKVGPEDVQVERGGETGAWSGQPYWGCLLIISLIEISKYDLLLTLLTLLTLLRLLFDNKPDQDLKIWLILF